MTIKKMGGYMKISKLFILFCFPLTMIASDQQKQEKKQLKELKVAMLHAIIKNCDKHIATLPLDASDVEYAQAYARGFYQSVPDHMPSDMQRKMKFQFILLHNVHVNDAAEAKSQCDWGLTGAKIGAKIFTQTTAEKLVNTVLAEHDERLQKAKLDKDNREAYEQSSLPRFLGLGYEDFIQKVELEADHLKPDTLHYHDIARELGYKRDHQHVVALLDHHRCKESEKELQLQKDLMHCELLAQDCFMRKQ